MAATVSAHDGCCLNIGRGDGGSKIHCSSYTRPRECLRDSEYVRFQHRGCAELDHWNDRRGGHHDRIRHGQSCNSGIHNFHATWCHQHEFRYRLECERYDCTEPTPHKRIAAIAIYKASTDLAADRPHTSGPVKSNFTSVLFSVATAVCPSVHAAVAAAMPSTLRVCISANPEYRWRKEIRVQRIQ
jgi:hypothetical protein